MLPTIPRRALTSAAVLAACLIPISLLSAQPSPSPAERQRLTVEYQRAVAAHTQAKAGHETATQQYWERIAQVRTARQAKRAQRLPVTEADYVREQPPDYAGPPAPTRPAFLETAKKAPDGPAAKKTPPAPRTPIVADFLAAARDGYAFVPRATEERDYMLLFAREALAQGLSAEQVVGVYGLETGGIGPYSRQSGVFTTDDNCVPIPPRGTPASSLALGYVQLLPANTAIVAEKHAAAFSQRLIAVAANANATRATELRAKAAALQRMAADIARFVASQPPAERNNWREYVAYGKTGKGLAVHALLLDADLGPWLQVQKLLGITQFAARNGLTGLDSARLELLNLVGDGRGVDALSPPAREAASANFFDRAGYDGNPMVAHRRTASGMLDYLTTRIAFRKTFCGSRWFLEAFAAAARERP
jgi:hypothetical protein